jgi:putative membrane protein
MTATRFIALVALGSSLAFMSACGGGSTEVKDPSATTGAAPSDAAQVTPPPPPVASTATPEGADKSAAPAPPAGDAEPKAPPLTDEQIAAIASTADKGEIEQAKLAQTTSKDAGVKKFAGMMVAHHGDNQKKMTALLQKQKITPQDNPISTQLAGDSAKLVETLKGQKGKDFDRAYIDAQVKEHSQVLDMLDNKLIPSAKNAEFKAALQAFRPKVEEHLKAAQELQSGLAGGK